MEIEMIAQRYGALPSDVRRAPASLIRHHRLIWHLEQNGYDFSGGESA